MADDGVVDLEDVLNLLPLRKATAVFLKMLGAGDEFNAIVGYGLAGRWLSLPGPDPHRLCTVAFPFVLPNLTPMFVAHTLKLRRASGNQLAANDAVARDLTLVVADSNVLRYDAVVVIDGVRRDHALFGVDRVDLRDELAVVVVGFHNLGLASGFFSSSTSTPTFISSVQPSLTRMVYTLPSASRTLMWGNSTATIMVLSI